MKTNPILVFLICISTYSMAEPITCPTPEELAKKPKILYIDFCDGAPGAKHTCKITMIIDIDRRDWVGSFKIHSVLTLDSRSELEEIFQSNFSHYAHSVNNNANEEVDIRPNGLKVSRYACGYTMDSSDSQLWKTGQSVEAEYSNTIEFTAYDWGQALSEFNS